DFADCQRDHGGDATSGPRRKATTTAGRERQAKARGRKLPRLFRPGLDRARVYCRRTTAKAARSSATTGAPTFGSASREWAPSAREAACRKVRPRGWPASPSGMAGGATRAEMAWAPLLPDAAARARLAWGLAIQLAKHPWRLAGEPIRAPDLTRGFAQGDPRRFRDAEGGEHDARRHSPAFFRHAGAVDCRAAIGLEGAARQGPSTRGWNAPPFWQPILDLASLDGQGRGDGPLGPDNCLPHRFRGSHLHHGRFKFEAHDGWRPEFLRPAGRLELGPHLHIFVDGSGVDQAHPNQRAAGWAQLARDGEDHAVKALTDTAAGGALRPRIDCPPTARRAACPEAAAPPGNQRARIWAGRAEQLQQATAVKSKAHLDQTAPRNGLITQFELDGGDRADRRAEEGATAAGAPLADVKMLDGCRAIARQAAQRAASPEARVAQAGRADSAGAGAPQLIDLGETPAGESDDGNGAPAAGSLCPDGSQRVAKTDGTL
ncbi:unnamed protein product, partial [Prorocentrum cordatum]